MIFLLIEFLDLIRQGDICQKQSAILLVVAILVLCLISSIMKLNTFEDRSQSQSPFFNKNR